MVVNGSWSLWAADWIPITCWERPRRAQVQFLAPRLSSVCVCVCVNNDFATTTVSVSSGGVGRERDGFKVKEEETRKKNALNFFKGETFFWGTTDWFSPAELQFQCENWRAAGSWWEGKKNKTKLELLNMLRVGKRTTQDSKPSAYLNVVITAFFSVKQRYRSATIFT